MGVVLAAAVCLALLVAALWKPHLLRPRAAATTLLTIPDAMRAVSPEHCALAEGHAREFEAHFQKTFAWTSADTRVGAELVRGLFARRAAMLAALHEVRLRAPNDLALEGLLAATAEDAGRRTMEHIEDARERCGVPLLHPVPLEDWGYGRWYRAANDVIQ